LLFASMDRQSAALLWCRLTGSAPDDRIPPNGPTVAISRQAHANSYPQSKFEVEICRDIGDGCSQIIR